MLKILALCFSLFFALACSPTLEECTKGIPDKFGTICSKDKECGKFICLSTNTGSIKVCSKTCQKAEECPKNSACSEGQCQEVEC